MRRAQIEKNNAKISVRTQCDLLSINRSGVYYKASPELEVNLGIMRILDEIFLENPTYGVISMVDELKDRGIVVNPKRVRRLLRLMGHMAIYPKKNLSKLGESKYIYPYLLRNIKITKSNQVWAIDITYIPMAKGYMYLTAIIDVCSRKIMGWDISNSLANDCCIEVLKRAISKYGKPEIINSDQGPQFTSIDWIEVIKKEEDISISMDGKGRAIDNIYIERFWKTLKQRYVYLNPEENGRDLYNGISKFMNKYDKKRHQGIGRVSPNEKYLNEAA